MQEKNDTLKSTIEELKSKNEIMESYIKNNQGESQL